MSWRFKNLKSLTICVKIEKIVRLMAQQNGATEMPVTEIDFEGANTAERLIP